jgi:hypothetical protein
MNRRGEVYEVRRSLVEGMWADGWSGREIADVLGWGKASSVSVLRNYGYDLPYRYDAVRRQNLFEGRWLAA